MLHILVIEDDEIYAALMEMALKREGLQITIAYRPEVGLEMMKRQPFDAVVLDVALPGISGIEVLQRIRHNPNTAHIPVLIATASGILSTRQAAEEAGADAFFEKPFSFHEMAEYIHNLYND